jgi:hypothetical protein
VAKKKNSFYVLSQKEVLNNTQLAEWLRLLEDKSDAAAE